MRFSKTQVANPSAKATGNGTAAAINGTSGMMAIYSRHWGPERSVVILRDPAKSLGISIVGGKVNQQKKMYFTTISEILPGKTNNKQVDVASGSGAPITGIFIKNVLPESPAGRTGQLRVRVPKPLTFSLRSPPSNTHTRKYRLLHLLFHFSYFFSFFFDLIIKSIDGRPDFRCGR